MPSESKALYTLVDPSSPPYVLRRAAPLGSRPHGAAGNMVEAPGTAPGSEWLITTAFIAIAGRIRPPVYRLSGTQCKAGLLEDLTSIRSTMNPFAAAPRGSQE